MVMENLIHSLCRDKIKILSAKVEQYSKIIPGTVQAKPIRRPKRECEPQDFA